MKKGKEKLLVPNQRLIGSKPKKEDDLPFEIESNLELDLPKNKEYNERINEHPTYVERPAMRAYRNDPRAGINGTARHPTILG